MLRTLLPGFVGTELPDWLAARLRAGLAGVCLFRQNIVSPRQLRGLTDAVRAANPTAVVAIDEEGGDVTRLFADRGSPSPGNAVLGRLDDLAVTERAAAQIGWQLRAAGCTVDFAPSVDVNSRADNPIIGVRSFGADPDRVARHGAAWIRGLQATGVAAAAKHFPGHGDTDTDSHLALPVVRRTGAELRASELVPFAAAVAAGAKMVMTSHLLVPAVDAERPATMSPRLLVEILRGELGFPGVVVSDALDMVGARAGGGAGDAAVRALAGGCDLLCLGTENTDVELTEIEHAVAAAEADGRLSVDRVLEAAQRVDELGTTLVAERAASPLPPGADDPTWLGDLDDLIATFDRSPGWTAWRRDPPAAYAVVRLEAEPNIAAGPTPWGPFAALPEPTWRVESAASDLPPPERELPVLAVGRDIGRHPFARQVVDRLRVDHRRVLVVEMGWPDADRRYADLATYGSSAVVSQALVQLLRSPG